MRSKLLTAVLIALSSMPAHAFLFGLGEPQPDPNCRPGITEKGARTGDATRQVAGFGNASPITSTLSVLAPYGWKITNHADPFTPVSWRGNGRPWPEILHEMSVRYGFCSEIDWRSKHVTVTRPAYASQPTATTSHVVSPPAAAPTSDTRHLIEVHPVDRFVVTAGETVGTALARWAEGQGMTLEWDKSLPDFKISHGAVFHGEFQSAVDALLSAVERHQKVRADIHHNRVLRVYPVGESTDGR